MGVSALSRAAATVIALTAWTGLAVQLASTLSFGGSFVAAIWELLRYFTIICNLIVAVAFTMVALGRADRMTPSRLGGVTVAIILVGIVYHLLLSATTVLGGEGARIANVINHTLTPVLVTLYWLLLAPRGGLRRGDPLIWCLLPIVYFVYALVRGAMQGRYPYPFLDVGVIGWQQTLTTALVIALCFVAGGYALVWLDGRLARRLDAR